MNSITEVRNHMINRGETVRITPVKEVTEEERYELFDDLCKALMEVGQSIGYRVDIYSGTMKPTLGTILPLTKLRLATYRTLCAYGFQDTADTTLRQLMENENAKPTRD